MALHLCRPKRRYLANPSLIHRFSTSENDKNGDSNDNNNKSSNHSLTSYFSDVKASLRQPAPRRQTASSPSSSRVPNKVTSVEEIRRNLAEFRQRSAVPPPTTEPNSAASQEQSKSQSPSQNVSFQELYRRNAYNETLSSKSSGKFSFDAITQSLRNMRAANANKNSRGSLGSSEDRFSLRNLKDTLKMKPEDVTANKVIGGTQELPAMMFGQRGKAEMRERMKAEFVKIYSVDELGEKLRKLRPEKMEGRFSLQELNERLLRLREMEENESNSQIGGYTVKAVRESLVTMKMEEEQKAKDRRLTILEGFGGTPEYLLHPPKEHLVEKYFHPDNMSSAEKMKIELAKVRDEFKMSESDCGSARVQIAQLTTKIKHLSSALHKKDKHSRKGLFAMVQRRKRLLKYLRRTDWDSYCFVLSKLGLRDNPDYKSLA